MRESRQSSTQTQPSKRARARADCPTVVLVLIRLLAHSIHHCRRISYVVRAVIRVGVVPYSTRFLVNYLFRKKYVIERLHPKLIPYFVMITDVM